MFQHRLKRTERPQRVPDVSFRASERGAALLISLFFAIVVTGVVMSGSIFLKASRTSTDTQFRVFSQANQFARSGLTEAVSWFRRQATQPVQKFDPQVDTSVTPEIVDTQDPEVGIVREFEIAAGMWGRYEVWKAWDEDPNAERRAFRAPLAATDISELRGLGSTGASWRLRSVGYLFRRSDENKAFDESPNVVVATRMLESEILRLKISPPGEAAISSRAGGSVSINNGGEVVGDAGAGIYYPKFTGTPGWHSSRVSGTPALAEVSDYDDSYRDVFGVSFEEVRSIADIYVSDSAEFPSPVPTGGVVVAEDSVVFNNARPLLGSGLVVVRGNVTIQSGSNSNFTGFLYVEGSITMAAPASISGAVVVTNGLTASGTGDKATVTFDDEALARLRLEVGQYRLAGAIRTMLSDE